MTDEEFFDSIYERCKTDLHTYFMRHVYDTELAQNLVHDTFLWGWAKIKDFRSRKPPEKWLYTTAKHLALREMDLKYHSEVPLSDLEDTTILSRADEDPFDRLPPGLKEEEVRLLRWRYIEQRKFPEMAELVGIKIETVKKRTYRASRHCRELLEQAADGEETVMI